MPANRFSLSLGAEQAAHSSSKTAAARVPEAADFRSLDRQRQAATSATT
ncbi:hypothetical protein PF003_g30672 [Phytophthora fragariae]|nr:hypothetical protein PF003_g30672 [Phytophthora fragariae]